MSSRGSYGDHGEPFAGWNRFWSHVNITEGCWLWEGPGGDYGTIGINGKPHRVHRLIWEWLRGPLGDLTIDHLCFTKRCVRLDHLEPVTLRENSIRGGRHGYAIFKANDDRRMAEGTHWTQLRDQRLGPWAFPPGTKTTIVVPAPKVTPSPPGHPYDGVLELTTTPDGGITSTLHEEVWEQVRNVGDTECKRHPTSSGTVAWNGRKVRVARLAWERVHGLLPDGHYIRQTCGTRQCVEPRHLLAGTMAEIGKFQGSGGTWRQSEPPQDQQPARRDGEAPDDLAHGIAREAQIEYSPRRSPPPGS